MSTPFIWNRMAQKYAEAPIKDEAGYTDTLDLVRKHLPSNASLLEVACGPGTTPLRLAPFVRSIVATDFSAKLIDIAKARQAEASPSPTNVSFQVGDASTPPGDDASYDAVLIMNTLHLMPNAPKTMAALTSKLKPGGIFISKTSRLSGKPVLGAVFTVLKLIPGAPHLNFFTTQDIDKLHTDANLEIIDSKDYDGGARRVVVGRKL